MARPDSSDVITRRHFPPMLTCRDILEEGKKIGRFHAKIVNRHFCSFLLTFIDCEIIAISIECLSHVDEMSETVVLVLLNFQIDEIHSLTKAEVMLKIVYDDSTVVHKTKNNCTFEKVCTW